MDSSLLKKKLRLSTSDKPHTTHKTAKTAGWLDERYLDITISKRWERFQSVLFRDVTREMKAPFFVHMLNFSHRTVISDRSLYMDVSFLSSVAVIPSLSVSRHAQKYSHGVFLLRDYVGIVNGWGTFSSVFCYDLSFDSEWHVVVVVVRLTHEISELAGKRQIVLDEWWRSNSRGNRKNEMSI